MLNLRLLQLGDSALPVGGYTHSWGLETAIARHLVNDAATLEDWTRSWLRRSVGPFEGVAVAGACRSALDEDWPKVFDACEMMTASINAASLRDASREMGEQLLGLASTWEWSRRRIGELDQRRRELPTWGGWHYCVVFGVLGAMGGASPEETLGTFLNQAVLGMIAAGVRGIPIGHTNAQQILAYLHDDVDELARMHAQRELTTAGSAAPFYEVLCHEQVRLYSRLFRS